jgi:inosine/xanthosine triphosphatase
MRVVLGGTFDPLHKGHEALFQKAFELGSGDIIIIGLTTDAFAASGRTRTIKPYSTRKAELEKYLGQLLEKHPGTTIEINEIDKAFNDSITKKREADVFVVSVGTSSVAAQTNELRQKNGLAPLEIVAVDYVLADDGMPIKATRIHDSEIDSDGKLVCTVKIAVGTKNDVKVSAVERIFKMIYPQVRMIKLDVPSGVRDQPWETETIIGAKNRAAAAQNQASDAHFCVGIEAGLIWNEELGEYLDVQYCTVQDRGGRVTIGHGPGFYYPKAIIEAVKEGKTVGQAMEKATGIQNIGYKQGAIGFLTNNLLTRQQLTEQAVIMALVPRITGLY